MALPPRSADAVRDLPRVITGVDANRIQPQAALHPHVNDKTDFRPSSSLLQLPTSIIREVKAFLAGLSLRDDADCAIGAVHILDAMNAESELLILADRIRARWQAAGETQRQSTRDHYKCMM